MNNEELEQLHSDHKQGKISSQQYEYALRCFLYVVRKHHRGLQGGLAVFSAGTPVILSLQGERRGNGGEG